MKAGVRLVVAAVVAMATPMAGRAEAPSPAAIDRVFSQFGPSAPGCAVGVEAAAQPPLLRAYGSTDLEHGVANTVDSVFEAGSVSKQFTAAAVLLLAKDGKLSLDDDVRKYLPELPDYGRPITIAELLSHTSGLRDWGEVEGIAGWPRGDRVYSLDDVLRIASRQRALNYAPGTAWSYTNTGFNLLAIIVQRVSGQSLAAYTREKLLVPLGMMHTQWRDDFRRIVPGRAIAYVRDEGGAYAQFMPFENAYGNGGLLTTVGDLLVWNRALSEGRLGPYVTTELQRQAKLSDGRTVDYARGLFIERYHGVREVSHSGATAGYRAWLGRYPDQGLSIAILCNAGEARAAALAHATADLYLPAGPAPSAAAEAPSASLQGWYASDREGQPLHLALKDGRLETDTGAALEARPGGGYVLAGADAVVLKDGRIQLDQSGDVATFSRAEAYAPSARELSRIAGRYRSEEAQATYVVTPDKGGLRLTVEDRPDQTIVMKPAYTDAFASSGVVVRLVRGAGGEVTGLRVSDDRVWDLRFERLP